MTSDKVYLLMDLKLCRGYNERNFFVGMMVDKRFRNAFLLSQVIVQAKYIICYILPHTVEVERVAHPSTGLINAVPYSLLLLCNSFYRDIEETLRAIFSLNQSITSRYPSVFLSVSESDGT